jgi:hypothetical protein
MRFLIKGVALEPHAETLGASGVKKKWPNNELRKSVNTLIGQPVTRDNSTSVENVVGEVTNAEWEEGRGVVYEAKINDKEVAQKIRTAQGDLAPRLYHNVIEADEIDDTDEPQVVTDIQFDALFMTASLSEGVPGVTSVEEREENNE